MKNQVQCEGLRLLIVALAIACFTVFAHGAVVHPIDDGRPLSNPGMGFTMQYYSNLPFYGDRLDPADTLEWFPSATVCYLRIPWSKLEPEEGVFNWSALDTPAQRWLRRGGQIALRVTASEHWLRFATPEWVKDAGAKGTEYVFGFEHSKTELPGGALPWDPDFGDEVFLSKLENLVRALAVRYDGDERVAFVDIGSYGLWGEGHTFASSRVSEEKRLVDIKKHIDLWTKYFKKTQLVVSDDIDGHDNRSGNYPLLDYARSKGVSWRDDSILVDKFTPWHHADQATRYWKTMPVVLETQHYDQSQECGAWDGEKLVEAVEAHHASFLSIHGTPRTLYRDNKEAFDRIALRIGYRLRPVEIAWPDRIEAGSGAKPFAVSFAFANAGVAPSYKPYHPCLTVKDARGAIVAVLADGGFDMRRLEPAPSADAAVSQTHEAHFRIGADNYPVTPEGTFDVYLSVGRPDGTPVVELPLPGSDGERRYKIGKIEIVAADDFYHEFIHADREQRRKWMTSEEARRKMAVIGTPPAKARPDETPRWCKAKGVNNMRDLGGWTGLDGRRLKTGLVYRSAHLDSVKGRRDFISRFGIKTDLDLRSKKETAKLNGVSPLAYGVKFVNVSFPVYGDFASESGKERFRRAFAVFLDRENYPIVFHCAKGADRTGSLAFLLEGLLGVRENDQSIDWQCTAFYNPNPKFADADRYDKLVEVISACPGATWTDKFVSYAKDCGITAEEIETFRSIMLEKGK